MTGEDALAVRQKKSKLSQCHVILVRPSTDWVRPTHRGQSNLLSSVYQSKCSSHPETPSQTHSIDRHREGSHRLLVTVQFTSVSLAWPQRCRTPDAAGLLHSVNPECTCTWHTVGVWYTLGLDGSAGDCLAWCVAEEDPPRVSVPSGGSTNCIYVNERMNK